MEFLGKYSLYTKHLNSIYVEILDYKDGNYELDEKAKLKGSEDMISSEELTAVDDLNQYCLSQNNEEYLSLLACQEIVKQFIKDDGDVPKYIHQMNFIRAAKAVFRYWYLTEKETIPELPRKARLSKMDEFYEHFVRFVESETATEDEVRSILRNEDYWKNSSAYFAKAKAKYGISTSDLKQLPQFRSIDPKNTAID